MVTNTDRQINRSSCLRSALPAHPSTQVRFASAVPLMLPLKAQQRRSEIFPFTASETFTQKRMRRIGAGSPHSIVAWMGLLCALQTRVHLLKSLDCQSEHSHCAANIGSFNNFCSKGCSACVKQLHMQIKFFIKINWIEEKGASVGLSIQDSFMHKNPYKHRKIRKKMKTHKRSPLSFENKIVEMKILSTN